MNEQVIDRYIYDEVLTDAQAKIVLSGYLEDIYKSRKYLVQSTEQHGDRILARWRKFTQPKRAALLQTAEPNLPLHKGFAAQSEAEGSTWEMHRTYRKYHLLPYLDVDTLVRNPLVLLSLIYTRTINPPVDWASFDNEQLRTAWAVGAFSTSFNAGAVIMHGVNYGKWTPWEAKAAHRADILGFPRGRLVIEAQATLMKFLRKVVELLLDGLSEEGPASSLKWQQLLAAGLKTAGESATWSSFVYRPFAAPPRFDTDNLLAIVKARSNATGDHLWLLQTEPAYFKRYIRKISQTQLVDFSNNKEANASSVYSQIAHDVKVHWFWQMTVENFETLKDVYRRYRDSITPGSPLPQKVERALGAIELILVNTIHERSKHLEAMIIQRPGFRHMYDFGGVSRPADGTDSWEARSVLKRQFTGASGKALAYRTERMWFILIQLLGPPDEEKRFRYAMLLDMLDEHLSASSPAERGRLDDVLYETVSDFVTLIELLWTIRTHMPLYASRTIDDCIQTEHSLFWKMAKSRHHRNKDVDDNSAIVALRKFQNTAPPSGQRNRQWLDQFEALHGTSKDFWRATSAVFRQIYRNDLPTVNFEQNMGFLLAWSDTQYNARLDAKRNQILSDMQKPKASQSEDVFLPLPTSDDEKSNTTDIQSKDKIKTRGEARTEDAQVEELASELESARITIPVSKRTYTTFRYMFPVMPEERQKSIPWNTFVDSMTDAGFAVRNGGGSIVTFENIAGGGKIIFHRPHPDPTIDPIMLQSMGNRLNRWFGWDRETFALA
ncbi:hypothetical protein HBH98_181530 [Parastagonospora nodorum]|nr:hypothetical protein HBH52_005700 [Parastagonospora nodorum]KAH4074851.1 hypothetical protein HBH50_030640 [Parastagonospora nodorum]KAH4096911.1 hypothetical protein HBH48_039520 [Parastagonospora nodorum]KAH4120960.1 hypothetical protein HBH47_108540 [Parastagonospora nodorum]KAH4341199.1 hypothetical protein HBH98_181530 [Parastagonospora nodorum]